MGRGEERQKRTERRGKKSWLLRTVRLIRGQITRESTSVAVLSFTQFPPSLHPYYLVHLTLMPLPIPTRTLAETPSLQRIIRIHLLTVGERLLEHTTHKRCEKIMRLTAYRLIFHTCTHKRNVIHRVMVAASPSFSFSRYGLNY